MAGTNEDGFDPIWRILLSLLAWLGVSLFKGFDKDRAIPLGPFLSVAGIGSYIGSFYYPEFFHLFMIQ